MREHIAPALYYLGVHLLFASIVWIAASVLTSIRTMSATAKYWIWVATSLNFVLPLDAVVDPELVSALAKLANPSNSFLLRSAASSLLSQRLHRLTAPAPQQRGLAADYLLAVAFGVVLLASVFETIAHTACCLNLGT
jgi:hypothetical protein